MKKLCLLLAVLLLLTGCVKEPAPEVSLQPTVTTSEETVVPAQTTLPPETTENENKATLETTPDGEIVIPDFGIPDYEGELLIPYDPDREVYICCGSQDFDFYPGSGWSKIHILTRKPYPIEQIQVQIDSQIEVSVKVYDATKSINTKGYSCFDLSLYHYISMQGGDWKEIAQATEVGIWASEERHRLMNENDGPMSKELWQKFQKIMDTAEINEWGKAYKEAYEQYTLPETPMFYYYLVDIDFDGAYTDETVNEVTVMLGDEAYTEDVSWRFHEKSFKEDLSSRNGKYLSTTGLDISFIDNNPHNGGYIQVRGAMSFTAQKDMTITGLRVENTTAQVLGCRVSVSGGELGSMDFHWDMQQPLEISKDTYVKIDLILYSEAYADFYISLSLLTTMEYEIGDSAYSAAKLVGAEAYPYIWDIYLTAFAGIDMGGYYTCYYPFTQSGADWLEYIPESWKQ